MLVRQIIDPKLAQFAYLVGCPQSGEAIVIDPERDVDRYFDRPNTTTCGSSPPWTPTFTPTICPGCARWLRGTCWCTHRGKAGPTGNTSGSVLDLPPPAARTRRPLRCRFRSTAGCPHTGAYARAPQLPDSRRRCTRDRFHGDGERRLRFRRRRRTPRPARTRSRDDRPDGAIGARAVRSIQREFRPLPEFLQVWPAHGAGSACGKSLGNVPISTVGYELRNNPSIRAASDEQTFVDFILAGQPEPPLYFGRMKRENRRGPVLLPSLPAPAALDASVLRSLQGRLDIAVLDTRPREAFLAGHVSGSICADLDHQFCTVAGSYVDDNIPVYLIVDHTRLDEAVRALVRVGLDTVAGYIPPDMLSAFVSGGGSLLRTESIDLAEMELRRVRRQARVLDVRSAAEFEAGHVPGAVNVAHTWIATQFRPSSGRHTAARALQQWRAGGCSRLAARAARLPGGSRERHIFQVRPHRSAERRHHVIGVIT